MKLPTHPTCRGMLFFMLMTTTVCGTQRLTAGSLPHQASFTAQVSDNGVRLSWSIPDGSTERAYLIERSNGRGAAEVVVELEASVSCDGSNRYTHVDHVPSNGLWFYRLVARSADGSTMDLGMLAVPVDGPEDPVSVPAVFPAEVPAIAAQERMDLRMVDALGRVAPR